MKKVFTILAFLMFVVSIGSCTADEIGGDEQMEDVYATGGNSSAEMDADRD